MTFAVSLTQQTQESITLTELQYQLTEITDSLMCLTRQSSAVYEERSQAVQAYLAQNTDEDGKIDDTAFDYVHSAAFTAEFDRMLSEIQTKEKLMENDKIQVETRIKEVQTNLEDQEKMTTKNAENIFGYKK